MKFDVKVPPSLLELQKWMGELIARPLRETDSLSIPIYNAKMTRAIEKRIVHGPHLTAAQRIGIYNQQYWLRLEKLLQKAYPTLTRLFGKSDFNRIIAEPYLLMHPSVHWSLSLLGSHLPFWIDKEYRDDDKLLIFQAALVDEACDRLFYAKISPPLLSLKEDTAIFLQPSVICLRLDANLFAFRNQLLEKEPEEWTDTDLPEIDGPRKIHAVLYLSGEDIVYEEIEPAEWALLRAFEKGATLASAYSSLDEESARQAQSQIASWFQLWTQRSWLHSS